MKLIGRYVLFGKGDSVHGLEQKYIPEIPDNLMDLELEESLQVYISNLSIKLHKALELDLLEECN